MHKKIFAIFVPVIALTLTPNLISAISDTVGTDAQLSWLQQTFLPSEAGKIQLVYSVMNKQADAIEFIQVYVWSDTDLKGITVNLYETDNNSGIFEGKVMFTYDISTENKLQINDGDKIFVKYTDQNLISESEYEIISKSQIAIVDMPVATTGMSNMRIIDADGVLIKNVLADVGVQVSTDLENLTNETQPFIHILQIQNAENVTVQLSWIEGDFYPKQKFHSSSSWLPFESGDHTITSFVWESFDNPIAIAPPISKIIMVYH
ncbi:hypothetical protein [Nitrosopumilus sp.]|uniref:hypothetical protein n=1 Tax=Nitrosopumilus sp. TaxID=2024843 RepID=UPI002930E55F|nr:hypothetical protein [Nitrosopumilus sp.]